MYVYPQTDRLPHEPLRVRWSTGPFLVRLVAKAATTALLLGLTAGLWPLFLIGVWVWGWPPHLSRPQHFRRYLHLALTEQPPAPGIAPLSRAWLVLLIVGMFAAVPLHGLAWFLDDLLYGRALKATPVRAPLFVLSAARSGSTQISRYLEEDPHLVAPSLLQTLFPYLWLWRLVVPTLGRLVSPALAKRVMDAMVTEELTQRHEGHPYHTDTFEIICHTRRVTCFSPVLGPRVMREDLAFAGTAEHNRSFWEVDFVDFLDHLGRKTLLFAGPNKRLFIKGHFLEAGDALAARYPDAHFLTVIRAPEGRLKSIINHLHSNPIAEPLGAIPWSWLVAAVADWAPIYCEQEQDWFTRPEGPDRTVIRFTDYVDDLEGTMRKVYARCMGETELSAHVPTEHAPRERKKYRVARSLASLNVDTDALNTRLAAYRAWCQPAPPRPLTKRDITG